MKLDADFAQQIAGDIDAGRRFAGRAGSSRSRDVIVAATLLMLFVVAIVTRASVSREIGPHGADRRIHVAFLGNVVATVGVGVGLALALFSPRRG